MDNFSKNVVEIDVKCLIWKYGNNDPQKVTDCQDIYSIIDCLNGNTVDGAVFWRTNLSLVYRRTKSSQSAVSIVKIDSCIHKLQELNWWACQRSKRIDPARLDSFDSRRQSCDPASLKHNHDPLAMPRSLITSWRRDVLCWCMQSRTSRRADQSDLENRRSIDAALHIMSALGSLGFIFPSDLQPCTSILEFCTFCTLELLYFKSSMTSLPVAWDVYADAIYMLCIHLTLILPRWVGCTAHHQRSLSRVVKLFRDWQLHSDPSFLISTHVVS